MLTYPVIIFLRSNANNLQLKVAQLVAFDFLIVSFSEQSTMFLQCIMWRLTAYAFGDKVTRPGIPSLGN